MRKRPDYDALLREMMRLCFASPNDVVRLAAEPELLNSGLVEGLKLDQLAEIKRAANGAVEIKLIDRLKLMELLAAQLRPSDAEGDAGFWQSFFDGGQDGEK